MNDKELLEYMRKIDKNFNTHLENGTIEMSLEYYNLCEELMVRGINAMQKNQKYKEVIDRARVLVNNVYNSLENPDKPIKFYEELLNILNINERN